jgi:hypothetical protein
VEGFCTQVDPTGIKAALGQLIYAARGAEATEIEIVSDKTVVFSRVIHHN